MTTSPRTNEQLRECTDCGLATTRQRVVVGSGPAHCSLVVVGEAPGRHEDEGGQPFVGRSGQLLTRLIEEELGLSRDQYFITNMVKCRPPANRPPRSSEVEACRPWLEWQLDTLSPTGILCVGNTAARGLLHTTEGITTLRQRLHHYRGALVVTTFHPAAALRGGPNVVEVMRHDIRQLATRERA